MSFISSLKQCMVVVLKEIVSKLTKSPVMINHSDYHEHILGVIRFMVLFVISNCSAVSSVGEHMAITETLYA